MHLLCNVNYNGTTNYYLKNSLHVLEDHQVMFYHQSHILYINIILSKEAVNKVKTFLSLNAGLVGRADIRLHKVLTISQTGLQ